MTSHNPSLRLICGEPEKKPASFSRFVFPFAYKVQKLAQHAPDQHHRLRYEAEAAIEDAAWQESLQERKDYFTFETQQVLFKRAQWLRMNAEAWKDSDWGKPVCCPCRDKTGGSSIEVCLAPPRLVLFEWPRQDSGQEKEESLLQTGFLLVELYFPNLRPNAQPDLTDLLEINEIFRCYRRPYKAHWQKFKKLLENMVVKLKDSGSARTVSDCKENYEEAYLDRWTNLLEFPLQCSEGDKQLVWRDRGKKETDHRAKRKPSKYDDLPYADHRAYVWSAAIMARGGGSLQRAFCTSNWQAHAYGHWIKLLNVDPPDDSLAPSKTHNAARDFERQWAEERTYHRWEQWGTWYGFSYHSGVMLGPPSQEYEEGSNKKSGAPLWRHFREMYFDMALLLLYTRVTLFRLSRELSVVTGKNDRPNEPEGQQTKSQDYSRLRETFILFTIRYQFPLLSNQQQGIEMYDLARKHFDITDLYAEVQQEIETAHEFVTITEQKKSADRAERLTRSANGLAKIGIPLAGTAVVAGIFGMNAEEYNIPGWFYANYRVTWFDAVCKHLSECSWLEWLRVTNEFWAFFFLASVVLLAWPFTYYLTKRFFDKAPKAQGGKDV